MLLRAARPSCWRAPGRSIRPGVAVPRSIPNTAIRYGNQLGIFTTNGSSFRKQVSTSTAVQNSKDGEKGKPAKKGDLLSETTLGNKAQREADWAIMKEMTKYLWPKVGSGRRLYHIVQW